ncbi:MAG: hypothetical protein AAGH15_12950 [Myxococcota bacterium]
MARFEDETVDWLFDATGWWIAQLGGYGSFRATSTVLTPTPEHFPVDASLPDDALALDFFSCVSEHAGVRGWDFVLEPDEQPRVADALAGMSHPLTGPVEREAANEAPLAPGEPLPIPYDPAHLGEPLVLIASFARGVAHYVAGAAPEPYTDDPEQHAYLVDLGAVMLGFGVFLANASFRFYQTSDGLMAGWGYGRAGALSQEDLSYALALHSALLEVKARDVTRHLEANPRGFFKKARRDLEKRRREALTRLRTVEPPAGGPYRSAAGP